MKKLLFFSLLIIISLVCLSQQDTSINRIHNEIRDRFNQHNGDKLFNFKLMDSNGNIKKLNSFKHKVILLDFWATWCGACVNDIPDQLKSYNKLKMKYANDFEWINISVDKDTTAWEKLLQSKGKAGINLIGNIDFIQDTYHIDHYPTLVLIDTKYRILGFDIARLSWGPEQLEFLIYKAMQGINSASAFEQMRKPGTSNISDEFLNWMNTDRNPK